MPPLFFVLWALHQKVGLWLVKQLFSGPAWATPVLKRRMDADTPFWLPGHQDSTVAFRDSPPPPNLPVRAHHRLGSHIGCCHLLLWKEVDL